MFLFRAGHESGNIHKADERDVECVAEPHKAGPLCRSVTVKNSGQHRWLVGDQANRFATQSAETDYKVSGKPLVNFKELCPVEDRIYEHFHVIRLVWTSRNKVIEHGVLSVDRITKIQDGWLVIVIRREIVYKSSNLP